ncbi:MAG: hypothetical protein ABR985_14375 [Methanotrichaceae archaeon]
MLLRVGVLVEMLEDDELHKIGHWNAPMLCDTLDRCFVWGRDTKNEIGVRHQYIDGVSATRTQ